MLKSETDRVVSQKVNLCKICFTKCYNKYPITIQCGEYVVIILLSGGLLSAETHQKRRHVVRVGSRPGLSCPCSRPCVFIVYKNRRQRWRRRYREQGSRKLRGAFLRPPTPRIAWWQLTSCWARWLSNWQKQNWTSAHVRGLTLILLCLFSFICGPVRII